MSFCFWLKSSGYYKGCWLTKGCWVVWKWLRSTVIEHSLCLKLHWPWQKTMEMIRLAVPSYYPPGKTWLNYISTGVGLLPLTAGVEEIQQTKRDEISTNTIAMWSGKPTKLIFGNYPSEMWRFEMDAIDLRWCLVDGICRQVYRTAIRQLLKLLDFRFARCICRRPCNAWPRVVSAISGTCYPCRMRSGWVCRKDP